jgi:hypothetical protein
MEECKECQGTGVVAYSCCGDVIYDDTELCPTCNDYVGYEEEECECGITNKIMEITNNKKDFTISKKNEYLIDLISKKNYGGHFTIFSFTKGYSFGFGTVTEREDIAELDTYDDINDAIENEIQTYLIRNK